MSEVKRLLNELGLVGSHVTVPHVQRALHVDASTAMRLIALRDAVAEYETPYEHWFPLIGRPACDHCNAPESVHLRISPTGFSVGSGYRHRDDCPKLRCPHGRLWMEDCPSCDAERAEDHDS